jgi:hypothetical protein
MIQQIFTGLALTPDEVVLMGCGCGCGSQGDDYKAGYDAGLKG